MNSDVMTVMVSVSGVRGIVGRGLTPDLAMAYASALAGTVDGKRLVVGRDSRPSGEMLRHAVLAGLIAGGCDVVDIGIAPTPTVGRAVRFFDAAGGIQITASHNPAPWNGLKLFGPDGAVLPASAGRDIQARFETKQFRRVAWDQVGRVQASGEAHEDHLVAASSVADIDAVRSRSFRVFLDANAGAGGPIAQRLLESLGCTVVPFACAPDGRFHHEPEPIPENLTTIGPLVRENCADLGVVLDPDADRLALLDEQGRCLGEELTLALAVWYRLWQQRGPVVVNMSTSRVCADLAARFKIPFERTAVGEANVVAGMRSAGAIIGGEGNGGVIDPRVGWVRDPFAGMAMILSLMARSGKPISVIAAELPHYEIVKTKVEIGSDRLTKALDALATHWPDAAVNRLDGLRLDWPDRWLHVRPSNTEPIVRAIAEGPTRTVAEQLCEVAKRIIAG